MVDTLCSIMLILIVVAGTSSYRYHSAALAHKADLYVNAARSSLLLCESWAGVHGAETFDPVSYLGPDVTIATITGGSVPADFTLIGSYKIDLNGAAYLLTMSWKDIDTDLRALNVSAAWAQQHKTVTGFDDTDKTFSLTTYVTD